MLSKDPFSGLEPAALWTHFAEIVNIPRPSGQESAFAEWLTSWAGKHGFSSRRDSAGNICIYVPASQDISGSVRIRGLSQSFTVGGLGGFTSPV